MRCLTPVLFLSLIVAAPANAEPVSVHCTGKYYQKHQPYFVTYDIQTGHFILEFPGSNKFSGEIIAENDERLAFNMKAQGGRMLIYFDRKRNSMKWPGMPADELGRTLMDHECAVVSGRTMLSMFYRQGQFDPKRLDPVDAFSLTCPGQTHGNYFVTLDRATKVVVLEKEHAAGLMFGNITGIDDGIIKFRLDYGLEPFDLLWDESRKTLTWVELENNRSRPTIVQQCIATKPRSIMEIYPELSRWH
jgi:hypothetical protein